MFVSFIAALIKYENWEIIGDVLSNDIFIEQKESCIKKFRIILIFQMGSSGLNI